MSDEHAEQLIGAKLRRIKKLELQEAHFAGLTPPHIAIELDDLRAEIANFQYQRTQLIFQANGLKLDPPALAQGLILLVSQLRTGEPLSAHSAYPAIDYHRGTLRRCWLIATDDSLATAEALAQHFGAYRLESSIHMVANGGDVADTLAVVTSIYAQLEQEGTFSTANVIADITGGTKPMTAGMVLACGIARPMQYMLFPKKGLPSLPVLLHTHVGEQPA